MIIKYKDEIDKQSIINKYSNLFVVEERFMLDGNYLVFSDVKPPEEVNWQTKIENKISILQEENEKLNTQLNTVRASHSDLILDLDFRVMDIEDNLGIAPMKINLFNILGGEDNMNSTFMVVLDKIETGSYKTKDEIESICDRYLARGRITGEEYDMLMKALDKKEKENNQTPEEVK